MPSFHRNKYVIQIESLKDCKYVRLISTREHMETLARQLSQALENEASLRSDFLKECRLAKPGVVLKPDFSLGLWKEWATVAFEKTDRVLLEFFLERDLGPYFRFKGVYRGIPSHIPLIRATQATSPSVMEAKGDYVFVAESGKDWMYYEVYSTRKHLEALQHELFQALEKPEASLRPESLKPEDPTPLWEREVLALISGNKPGPVRLRFEIAPDLDRYHDQNWPERQARIKRFGCALIVTVLVAVFGYLFWVFGADVVLSAIILGVIALLLLAAFYREVESYIESKRD